MSRCNDENRKDLMKFLFETPFDEEAINMDCNDGCEQISNLAERVAKGEDLQKLLPEFKAHMDHWKDCREEFTALVAVIRAENTDEDLSELDKLEQELDQHDAQE